MPEIKPTQMKDIDAFVDKMITDKGLNLAAEQRTELQSRLREKIEERTEQGMLRALSDEQLMELEGLVDGGAGDDELDRFFENSGVDSTKVMAEAMNEFREAYLNGEMNNEMGEA